MSWINDAIFYNIYPLGFCGAPEYNDKTEVYRLDKIYEWIPEMKQLGITALVFNPVFESTKHGYDTKDYFKIDCRLGSNESFRNICLALHKNGIRVLLDGVFNHVGREFFAFKDVQNNLQGSSYCGWFKNLNFSVSSPCGDRFGYEGWAGNFDLVKLNLQNREVVNYLLAAVKMWIEEFDIDGLRLDAADCIDDHFFRELRSFCRSKKEDFWLYGEIIHGDYNRWANQDMLDSVTNYECYKGLYSSHNDHNYFEIAHSLQRQFGSGGIYKNIFTYNFLDNHDVNRIASTLKEKSHLGNIHTLLYTMPGAPSIYYGSEWAIPGMRTKCSDTELRPCLDLNSIPNPDVGLFEHLTKLGKIRHSLSALKNGNFENTMIKNEQFVFRRKNDMQTVYVALNLSGSEQWIDFKTDSNGFLTDVLNGCVRFDCGNQVRLPVPASSARILVLNDDSFLEVTDQPEAGRAETSPYNDKKTDNDSASEAIEILPVRLGRYRHFKGNEYEVVGFAKHSETRENMVIYKALYGEYGLWVRPYDMFCEIVEADKKKVLRFTPID